MMEEESACSSNYDFEPKDKQKAESDWNHVMLHQTCATEKEEVELPFHHKTDSLALLSLYRYTKRIKDFLGWENSSEDSDTEDNSGSGNLSVNKQCSNDNEESQIASSEHHNQNNSKGAKEDLALDNLLVENETCLGDNQGKGLSLAIINHKEKYKESEELDGKCEDKRDIISDCNLRNSFYLDIKDFSDYLSENKKELFKKSYDANENEKNVSISEENFRNRKCQKEIFRSEFMLDVENCINRKPVLSLNSKLDNSTQFNSKNVDMDELLLMDKEAIDVGLVMNNEDSIIHNKNITTVDNNENEIENHEKPLHDFIPEDAMIKYSDIIHIKVNSQNDSESTDPPEESSMTEQNDVEVSQNSCNEVTIETERKKSILEKTEKLFQHQDDDLLNNTNYVGLFTESAPTGSCKNSSTKGNYEKNVIHSKIDMPFTGQSKSEKITGTVSKEDEKGEKQNLEECEEDTVCGVGIFRPQWLQPYATAKVYVILYSIIGILHGSYYSYLIGTLSTLEKRYSFKSKISGVIMIADEVTPLLLGMVIGYYSSKAHRPRIVALGMLLSAGCAFVTSLPYFIYGPMQSLLFDDIKSKTGPEHCDIGIESCDPDRPQNLPAVFCFIFGSFLKGFGNLAYYAIGLVYLDDNSDKKDTPIFLAISLALRLVGPLFGFLMSSGFLKFYENPLYDPGFGPDDPRWIGAWWIGFFLQGILLTIFTIPIALFPRRLPSQRKIEKIADTCSEGGFKVLFKDCISALKRLLTNPVFIVLIINTNMVIFGHFGPGIMLPKYMENQFKLSASQASLFSGALTVCCVIISTLLGGFVIWKYRPRIKVVLGGMIACEIILCVGFLILMIPRCQLSEMSHFGVNDDGLILNSICNKHCDCTTSSYTPFCGQDGKTLYFSPCHAGCTEEVTSSTSPNTKKKFGNCSCVDQQQLGTTISEGVCPDENCWSQMLAYLLIYMFLVSVSNFFTVASTMILLRSVHPNDKSIALGTFETFICLFGFIPFPVTFGALVDSACLVWEKSCGETGNCWFYDMEKYAYLLHGTSALFCSLSVVCLIILYFLSPRIRNLYDEEDEKEDNGYVDIKLDTVYGSVTKL